jgi:hypothetical protein
VRAAAFGDDEVRVRELFEGGLEGEVVDPATARNRA